MKDRLISILLLSGFITLPVFALGLDVGLEAFVGFAGLMAFCVVGWAKND